MGYYGMSINVRGKRSAHNSINDKLDTARWEYLADRIRALLESDDYERLEATVEGPHEC